MEKWGGGLQGLSFYSQEKKTRVLCKFNWKIHVSLYRKISKGWKMGKVGQTTNILYLYKTIIFNQHHALHQDLQKPRTVFGLGTESIPEKQTKNHNPRPRGPFLVTHTQ